MSDETQALLKITPKGRDVDAKMIASWRAFIEAGTETPLVHGRTCGTCRQCCHALSVADIDKPAGEWCKHVSASGSASGCSIYSNRPVACKSYYCFWLLGAGAKNERPDKSGFIVDFTTDELPMLHIRLLKDKDLGVPPVWLGKLQIFAAINGYLVGSQFLSQDQCLPTPHVLPKYMHPIYKAYGDAIKARFSTHKIGGFLGELDPAQELEWQEMCEKLMKTDVRVPTYVTNR